MDQRIANILKLPEFGVSMAIIAVVIIFSSLSDKFLTAASFGVILTTGAELGIMTIGIAFLMISGEFDLSVSSVFAIAPLIVALFLVEGINIAIALLVAFGVACLVGLFNGAIVEKVAVPSFIITLGMQMLLRGIIYAKTEGFPIKIVGNLLFREAMAGKFYGDFRASIIWLIFLCIIFALILGRTRYGNWVFAVGGNKKTARVMGIKVTKVKLLNFMLCSVLGAFAGIIAISRFGAVGATTGVGWELEAIAAAVIGGCLLTGGYGSIIGAVMGAILISLIKHGLVLVGAPAYWYTAFIGIILIAAAVLHVMIRRWAEK